MSQEDDQRAYLASVMERTGWNQTELAQRAGLDPSTLSRFLTGIMDVIGWVNREQKPIAASVTLANHARH